MVLQKKCIWRHTLTAVPDRLGHRFRWTLAIGLLVLWLVSLVTNVGGEPRIVLLVAGVLVVLYELLAAERAVG